MEDQQKGKMTPKRSSPSKKPKHTTDDYTVLSVPEDPTRFAVVRRTDPEERFLVGNPSHPCPLYQRVIYLISPFVNYETGEPGESCSCLHWITRKTRCIHLRKFYELNPHLDKGEPIPPEKTS